MFGGGAFKSVWNAASAAAKATAAGIATGAHAVAVAAEATAETAVAGGKVVVRATAEATQWAEKQTVNAATWAGTESVAAANATAKMVKSAFRAARTMFSNAVAAAAHVACSAENAFVKEKLSLGALVFANPKLKALQDWALGNQPKGLPHDGEVVGAGCKAYNANSGGTLPQCPYGPGKPRGKLTYVNGILTDYHEGAQNADKLDGICKTMQKLANATCAEVTGVYNATGGMRADLGECLKNIAKSSESPAVDTLELSILSALRQTPPQDMTIYAHSQGGLITQEALVRVKNDLRIKYGETGTVERMNHLSIKSFGTAEEGWPIGPNYEQFTNDSDAVPAVIAAAQEDYPDVTFKDNATIPPAQRHHFDSPRWNPKASHSIDDVYIEALRKIHGQPNCCG